VVETTVGKVIVDVCEERVGVVRVVCGGEG